MFDIKTPNTEYRTPNPLFIQTVRTFCMNFLLRKTFPVLAAAVALLATQSYIAAQTPASPAPAPMPWVQAKGPHLINERGDTLIFKGLSISDPDKIRDAGQWSKQHFKHIKSWGAQLVRIPVHPKAWRKWGEAEYLKMLDQAVQWCSELEMYVIIDWHSIGNLEMELFQNPDYDTSQKETFNFWRTIAQRYKDQPTVAFFELFNEPTTYFGQLGECSWTDWVKRMEQCIDLVRANGARAIPLIGGFDWAYDLRDVNFKPIAREGLAYVTHPYPGKCKPPREPHWETHFGYLADRYPIVATEVGFTYDEHGSVPLPDDGIYTQTLLPYLKKKRISWCAWVFDPHWEPPMIQNWSGEPTREGAFWREALLQK